MNIEILISIIISGATVFSTLMGLIVSLIRGEMKNFIKEKMIEAEKSSKSGSEKLKFVIESFKEKYKIMQFILNCRKFIEKIISITKEINYK